MSLTFSKAVQNFLTLETEKRQCVSIVCIFLNYNPKITERRKNLPTLHGSLDYENLANEPPSVHPEIRKTCSIKLENFEEKRKENK